MMRAHLSGRDDHSEQSAVTAETVAKPRRQKSAPAKPCFVYVLGSLHKGRHLSYVGWTNDVTRRVAKHNDGTGARSTRGRVWVLLHTEAFETRNEAMSREWHLKRDRAFRKKLLTAAKMEVRTFRTKAAR